MILKILLSLFLIVLIPNAFAVTEISNSHGSLTVEKEVYEVVNNIPTNVKITGTVTDYKKGERVDVIITDPDGLTEGSNVLATEDGYFETFWIVMDDTTRGEYTVMASYVGQIIGQVQFSVQDKVYTQEELDEARGTSNPIEFALPETVDDVSETITSEENTVEEISEIEQGITQEEKEKINSFLDKAIENYDNQEYRVSETYFNQILRIDPNHIDALNGKGMTAALLGNPNGGLEYVEQAIEIDPQNFKSHFNKARVLFFMGQDRNALNSFEKAIELNSEHLSSIEGKAMVLYYLGMNTESINNFKKVLQEEPDNINALFGISLSFSDRNSQNDQFDALININKVLELDPNYPDGIHNKKIILNMIGQKYDQEHNFQSAISYYDKILEIDPEYIDALNNKAASLYLMGQFEESIVFYDKALLVDPNFVHSLTGKGTALNDLGRYEEAIPLFDKALSLDSSYSLAHQNKQFSLQQISIEKQQIAEKEEQNFNMMIILIGIASTVGIVGGAALLRKYKNKSNIDTVIRRKKLDDNSEQHGNTKKIKKNEWEGI